MNSSARLGSIDLKTRQTPPAQTNWTTSAGFVELAQD